MDDEPLMPCTGTHSPGPSVPDPTVPLFEPSTKDRTVPITVVVADGHCMFRQGLAALLSAHPNIELLAQIADGGSAWQAIQTHEPDVAILDLALTGTSGIEIVRRIEAASLPTRCLLLATHGDPGTALQALRAGASGYVLKDAGFEELMLAMHSIDAGGTFVTPSIAVEVRALRRSGHTAVALSPREIEIVRLLAAGKTSKQIGQTLAISPQTVDTHRRRLMAKLRLHSATEVVRYAAQTGWLG